MITLKAIMALLYYFLVIRIQTNLSFDIILSFDRRVSNLVKAFYIVYFMSTNKKGITSTELARKLALGHNDSVPKNVVYKL